MNDLVKFIFLYFARYPKFESVAKSFNKGASNVTGYAAFKEECTELVIKNLVPEITDYVFGVNEDRIKKRINAISGYYLFVDYGSIEASPSPSTGHTQNYFNIAITVAFPINPDNMDDADEVLISSNCLNYLKQIKERMKLDDKDRLIRDLKSDYNATPFVARELHGSIGWTMTFIREGVLL
jgi:hypothetical protein